MATLHQLSNDNLAQTQSFAMYTYKEVKGHRESKIYNLSDGRVLCFVTQSINLHFGSVLRIHGCSFVRVTEPLF